MFQAMQQLKLDKYLISFNFATCDKYPSITNTISPGYGGKIICKYCEKKKNK